MKAVVPQAMSLPPPLLSGKGIALVAPDHEHWETIRAWESDAAELHLWTHRNGVPTRQQFEESFTYRLRHYYFAYFLVLGGSGEPAGFTYLYESRGESAFLTTYIDAPHRRQGLAVRGTARLLHWAFSFHSFERILADSFGYNAVSEQNLRRAGFTINGEIQRHRRYQGVYYPLKQWELTRSGFYERHLRLLKREIP